MKTPRERTSSRRQTFDFILMIQEGASRQWRPVFQQAIDWRARRCFALQYTGLWSERKWAFDGHVCVG